MRRSRLASRRDLLRRPLTQEAPGRSEGLQENTLLALSRRAMACEFEVAFPRWVEDPIPAGTEALDLVDDLEKQLSAYREDSELSRINDLASAAEIPISQDMFDLLIRVKQLHQLTDGALDIAAGALVKCWGFFRGPCRIPSGKEIREARDRSGMRFVELNPMAKSVRFAKPGLDLNLGAIGKGYALDRVARLLKNQWGVRSGLVHGGQSSVLAWGNPDQNQIEPPGVKPSEESAALAGAGWRIGITHPMVKRVRVATVRLENMALGTSGATFQYFWANGKRYGHILDPRTGWPSPFRACVSVLSTSAADADGLSTALFILGPAAARIYAERHPELGVILVHIAKPGQMPRLELLGKAEQYVQRLPL